MPLQASRDTPWETDAAFAGNEERISLTMSNTGNLPNTPPDAYYGCCLRSPRSRSWRKRDNRDQRRREVRINGAAQLQRLADAVIENSDDL